MIITPPNQGFGRRFAEFCDIILITSLFLTLSLQSNRGNSSRGNAGELAGGGQETSAHRLVAGQYLRVSIAKQDLHLSVKLYGPQGQQLLDFQSRRYGPLVFSFVPETTGSYRFEVHSLETEAAGRPYQLSVEALREASAQDRKEADAYEAFYDAERLRAEWKEDSLREAIRKYDKALTIWRSISHQEEEIETLINIGELCYTLSDYARALTFYEKALALSRAAGMHHSVNKSLNSIGYVLSYMGQDQKALGYFKKIASSYDRPQSTSRTVEDGREEARALCGMGEIYNSQGNLQLALDLFQRAQEKWTAVGDRGGQARAHLNSGHAYTDSGEASKASKEFEQARALWRAIDDRRGEALALTAIGGIHSLQGKKQLALASHQQALSLFRSMGDRHSEAVALNGIARAYEEMKEFQTALDNYSQALKLYQQNNSWEFESATEYSIGRVYRWLGDNSKARAHYEQSIRLSRKVNKRRLEAYALLDIAAIFNASNNSQQALNQYHQILQLYRSIGDRRGQAQVYNNIGDIYYASGAKHSALGYYKRALRPNQLAKDSDAEATTFYNIARAERDCGYLDDSLSSIKSAIKIIEFLRVQIASPTLRSSYFAASRNHYGFYIDLLMLMHKQRPTEGFAKEALQASESARARALLELLTESKIDIRQGVAPQLLERESSLQQLLSTKARYRTRLLNSENTEKESEALEREIRQLTTDYEEVQAHIREQSPRYAALTQPQPLRVEDIQAELKDEQTLLLEYVLGEEKSYLWAVTSTSIESYELPGRATVEEIVDEANRLFTARPPVIGDKAASQANATEPNRRGEEQLSVLSDMLLGPVAARLGNKRLLIVPDGVLQYLPFAALPEPSISESAGKEPTVNVRSVGAEFVPLILRHEVVSLPSASTLAALRQNRSSRAEGQGVVAVLADPVFESDDPRVRASVGPPPDKADAAQEVSTVRTALRDKVGPGGTSLRLPFTRREADEIMAVSPPGRGLLATDFAANRATAMSDQLGRYQIVHFATHGIVDDKRPEFSGIVLSLVDKQGNAQDGFLQLHDVYNLNWSAKLVVLSACDTGLGKDVKGEGLVGLTRGFMYAGSKSVMASLWKVDDRATAELMGHFYRAMLQEKLSPAAALRSAQIAMWKQPRWRAPYYWAAFVLQGEYAEAIQTGGETWESSKLIVLLILGALTGAGVYVFGRRKKTERSIEGRH